MLLRYLFCKLSHIYCNPTLLQKNNYSITQIAKEPGVTAMNTAIIRHLMLICFILTEEKNVSESKKMSAEATERALSA